MVAPRHVIRLLSAMIALCGAFVLQRAEACFQGDLVHVAAESGADALAGEAGPAGFPAAAASVVEPGDAAGAGGPAGFDPDSGDDCAPARAWTSRPIASIGLPVIEGGRAIHQSARCPSRSARGPPATA